ncbi:MAG: tetratricopeptide repeat protein [Acidobacteria bacterium]|nr:tetratricopeptide repeat protein [Acidobacteriota bacterium]
MDKRSITTLLSPFVLGLLAVAASAQIPSHSRSASAPAAAAPAAVPSHSPTFSAPMGSRSGSIGGPSYGGSRGGYSGVNSMGTWGGTRNSVFPRPEYPTFTGRVTTAVNGPTPIDPVRATCNCGNRMFDLGYLRFGSSFQFMMGGPFGLPLQPWMFRSGCSLSLYAPGYRAMTLPLMLDPYNSFYAVSSLGKIRMEPYEDVSTVSATSYTASKEARKAYEKGVKKLADGKLEDAKQYLQEAVALHPTYASAWTVLGHTLVRLDDHAGARAAYERAVESDPDYVSPYQPLVRLVATDKDWQRVMALTEKAVALNPYDAELKYQRSVAALQLEQYELARDLAERVFTTDDGALYPESGYVLAKAYRALGETDKAIRTLEEYLERDGKAQVRRWARNTLDELRAEAGPSAEVAN